MRILNILSSHYEQSFNNVLMQSFQQKAIQVGHTSDIIDLYKLNFNPVMKGDDFNQFMNKDLPKEIIGFHEQIKQADILTFFYPVWWNDMPAIMKGWLDRVLSKGFAYNIVNGRHQGELTHIKKVILVCTLGNNKEFVLEKNLEYSMRTKEAEGVFNYCGVKETKHYFFYDVYNSEEIRKSYIKQLDTIISDINQQT